VRHAASLNSWNTTEPVAELGVTVALSSSVAVQLMDPTFLESVARVTSTLAIVTTQSDGSEFGSCDG